jgi:hypothetical protein
MKLSSHPFFRIAVVSEGGHMGVIATVALSGSNAGHRPITVVGAGVGLEDGEVMPWLVSAGDEIPKTLGEGDNLSVEWDLAHLERCETTTGKRIVSCGFMDTLGNRYMTPLPGVKLRRSGRLRRTYVIPALGDAHGKTPTEDELRSGLSQAFGA